MKFLAPLTGAAGLDVSSDNTDTIKLGSSGSENSDANVDNLIVWANADFKNNVSLGSSAADIITINGIISSSAPISASYFYGDGSNLINLPTGGGGAGTITGVIAGSNLSGGGSSNSITLSLTSSITGGLTNLLGVTNISTGYLTASSINISGSSISLTANNRSAIQVVDERLDLIVTGSRVDGTQLLIDVTNASGDSQFIAQAGNYSLVQAGTGGSHPFYFQADSTNKFVCMEADDLSGTIYVGGTGYSSAINIGTAGSRNISIGNTSGSTAVVIKGGTAGVSVTGSLQVSGAIENLSGGIKLSNGLIQTTKHVLADSGSFNIYSIATNSCDAAFFDYVARSGSNIRAGQIITVWNNSSVNYTEITSSELGSTGNLILGAYISDSNMILTASASTGGWTIKTIVKAI